MGREYNGSIEGKFWVCIQPSDDGEFFGATECNKNTIDYVVEDIETVKEGLKTCLEDMRKFKVKLDKFFKINPTYSDEKLAEVLGLDVKFTHYLVKVYARYLLGKKIYKFMIEEEIPCYFTADI